MNGCAAFAISDRVLVMKSGAMMGKGLPMPLPIMQDLGKSSEETPAC
jgi:hypothetical protein